MKYLSLFTNNHFVAYVLNIKTATKEQINHAYGLIENLNCTAVLSNYKDVLKAEFKRRADTGQICLSDIPQRLDTGDLLHFLDDLSETLTKRQHKKRNQHPNSLANLSRSHRFTSGNRPNKPRKVQQHHVDRAIELRHQGCSWRLVGDRLGLNASSIRSAVRFADVESAKQQVKTRVLEA